MFDKFATQVSNGATYVHVDSTINKRDGKSSILIVEDNGGGMNPSTFRECLSLGYSRKRNMANRVGQCKHLKFIVFISFSSARGIN